MDTLSKQFSAVVKELDFVNDKSVTLKVINADVENATHGLIKNLFQDIDSQICVILVNAIYFKGLWAVPFNKTKTNEQGEFTKNSGQIVKTPLMFKKSNFPFYYDETSKAKFVQLDYTSGNIAMVLVLPDKGQSLGAFIDKSLNSAFLIQALDKLESFDDVRLTLPRFKLDFTLFLANTLQRIGIRDVFIRGKANLTNMSVYGKQLYVSEVIQKAVIEINEEGIEAAAATGVMMRCMRMPSDLEFKANRPFLYMLVAKHDQARQILFIGTVEDPTKSH